MKLEIALLDETELANAVEDDHLKREAKQELKRRTSTQHETNHDDLCCCIDCL